MISKDSIVLVVVLAAFVNARTLPPPACKSASLARYVLNKAEWTSIATISTRENIKNYPVANLVDVTDGAKGKGNGVPYVFMSTLSATSQNLAKDNRATMFITLEHNGYCQEKGYDPMDHRCPKVVFTGRIKKIPETDSEYETAKKAVFTRHEFLSHVPANHNFYFAKLEIETIDVLASFGGAQNPTLDEYYHVNKNDIDECAHNLQ